MDLRRRIRRRVMHAAEGTGADAALEIDALDAGGALRPNRVLMG